MSVREDMLNIAADNGNLSASEDMTRVQRLDGYSDAIGLNVNQQRTISSGC